ncbi:MAG: hypothetical protein KDB14_19350 [Planctomycetales bacterium]|nr:hypothetical protein [Planctomycetales bacterium]
MKRLVTTLALSLVAQSLVTFSAATSVAEDLVFQQVPETRVEVSERRVRYFNRETGRYEWVTVYEEVPVQVLTTQQISGRRAQFAVEFVNNCDGPATLYINNGKFTLRPGEQHHAHVVEGQDYSWVGPPSRTPSGQMLGGVSMAGQCRRGETTVYLGGATQRLRKPSIWSPAVQGGDDEPQATFTNGGLFQVTFYNHYQGPITINLFSPSGRSLGRRTIQPGKFITGEVRDGASFEQEGPVVYGPGTAKSSTSRGVIRSSNPDIHLGR